MAKEKKDEKGKREKVEKKEKKTRVKVTVPPSPPKKIGGVSNPLMESKTLKRALAVAIYLIVKNKEKAAALIRASGICFKKGITEEQLTDPLHQGEWNGMNYANWASKNTKYAEAGDKQKERLTKVAPFAKAIAKS